jgi:hypothetical protein
MAEINNRFRVKKGLEVQGDSTFSGNVDVSGVITVPTLAATENSTKVATTEFVRTAIANLIASSPAALDTLNELAAALGNDPNFATTMTNALALKAPLASPALTGSPTAPTPPTADASTLLATTQYVKNQAYATLASPALSGIPTSPTAAPDTNTTQIATAAFVLAQAGTANPLMNGAVSVGTSYRYSRQDHVHPIDTSRAPLDSPGLTGTPTSTTPAFGDNTTRIPTTAFVQAALAATGIGYDAAAIPGGSTVSIDTATIPTGIYVVTSANTGTKPSGDTSGFLIVSRATSTVHQLYVDDTTARMWSRAYASSAWTAWREVAYTDSPALTGVPTAPTAAANTNSTQIATTAYADAIAALKANINNPAFTGNATVAGSLSTDDYAFIAFPDNGNYISTAASVTGAIKIKLPVLYNTSQVSFDLTVNEAVTDSSMKMRISGLNRGSDNTWQFVTAYTAGGVASRISNVRFGNDGTSCCIWVGELADTWATPQIQVSNISVGNAGVASSWLSGWAVSYVTTFDTVKTGPITPSKAAGINSPAFTGVPTAPTAAPNTNTTQIATTAYADAIAVLKANLASPTFTGVPAAPTAAPNTNTTQIATTAYADAIAVLKANIASPTFTGTPAAPTPSQFDNSTKLATTAFVKQAQGNAAGALAFNSNQTLTVAQLGYEIQYYGPTGGVFTLPSLATIPAGYGYTIYNQGAGTLIVTTAGGDTLYNGSAIASITLQKGDNLVLNGRGSTSIDISGGTASLQFVQTPTLVSPNMTGTPIAPTPAVGDVSTKVATTAFAQSAADNSAIVYAIVFG